jgi:SRSO17 transposase
LGGSDGVLIVDDTGFVKKGTRSAGVQRQYSGTAGRTENCQIGTFLAYASWRGHALIDRELYLPESWTSDRDRCRAAGIPDEVEFATKPRLAMVMLQRAFDAGVPFGWVTADEAYGQVKYLRVWLEEHDTAYVLATRRNDDAYNIDSGQAGRVDELVAALPARAWRRLSAGAGAHGPREYDWARVPIRWAWRPGRGHWLLARRSIARPSEIAYFVCYGPRRSTLVDLAWIAGSRWRIEECFQQGQDRRRLGPLPGPHLAGLVRPHHPLDARPGLAVSREIPYRKGGNTHPGMINYTLPEIRRLLTHLVLRPAHPAEHHWSWSTWRRRRQHQARHSHYRRRGHPL